MFIFLTSLCRDMAGYCYTGENTNTKSGWERVLAVAEMDAWFKECTGASAYRDGTVGTLASSPRSVARTCPPFLFHTSISSPCSPLSEQPLSRARRRV